MMLTSDLNLWLIEVRVGKLVLTVCGSVLFSSKSAWIIKWDPFWGGIKVDANVGKKLRDLPYNSALFGLVMTPDPSKLERLFTQG